MTRVLYWNVQTFGNDKLFDASRKRKKGNGGLSRAQAATQRRQLFGRVLTATQPDIIVMIEVASGFNGAGDLATQTAGMTGLVNVKTALNNTAALNAGGWNLVPPIHVGTGGRTETVGILYRRQNAAGTLIRYFTGPNIWTGGFGGNSVDPAGGAAAAAYPVPGGGGAIDINAMLVPGGAAARMIPGGAQHNGGLAENVVAARRDFDSVAMGGGAAGPALVFGGLREPTMVTFTETNAAGAIQRDLTLFAVHSPPQGIAAAAYMNAFLAGNWDVVRPLGMNENRVIGGDFNLSLLTNTGARSNAYNPLTNVHNYTLLLQTAMAGAPPMGSLEQYKGYFATHLRGKRRTAASRFLWSNGGGAGQSFYPGYGYMGSNFVPPGTPFESIDNILVWPFLPGPHNYQTTVMNLVTGTPFNQVGGMIPGNPPQGTIALTGISNSLMPPANWPVPPPPPAAPNAVAPNYPGAGPAKALTGWANYGKIHKLSDHFAVYATV